MDLIKIDERLQRIESLLFSQKTVLNIDELSQHTGLSKSSIYKFTCGGIIPHYKKAKHLYFDRVEIEAWQKSNKIKSNEEIEKEASTYVTLNSGRG